MSLTEEQCGLLTAERLKLPRSAGLGFQTYIGNALNNLALDTVNDAQKRRWLITDPSTTSASVVFSNGQYYADLSTLMASPQVMIDYLNYGTIYVTPIDTSWDPVNVDTTDDTITLDDAAPPTGTPVQLTLPSGGTLPAGLALNTTYFTIFVPNVTPDVIQLATTVDNAASGNAINLTTTGSGTVAIKSYGVAPVLQWLNSPNQGQLTSAIPIAYPTGWLVDTRIYLNNVGQSETLNFAVPFVPTLVTLPDFLQNDAIDACVNLAIAGGQELPKSVAER